MSAGRWDAPITGKHYFLGVICRVLLEEISIFFSRMSNEDLPSPVWVGIIRFVEGSLNRKWVNSLSLFLSWDVCLSVCLLLRSNIEVLVLGLSDSETYTSGLPFLRLWPRTES